MGTTEYRKTVFETRKISADQPALPEHIAITQDGKATRILGAWLGNTVDQISVWTPTVEKIKGKLKQWSKSFPTIEGKTKIVQMTVAGMTQYLTSVQGMPNFIEEQLEKITRNFFWGDKKKAPFNRDILYQERAAGGKKLISIKDRNKAIKLKSLQRYLNLGSIRPVYAFFLNRIFAKKVSSSPIVDPKCRINPFLPEQLWSIKMSARNP